MLIYKNIANMRKEAFDLTSIVKGLEHVTKDYLIPSYKYLVDNAKIAVPAVGVAAAYGLAKGTKPTHITNNSDKELYLNTLKTEVAAARRQLEAMEAQNKLKGSSRRVFDKFLG